MLAQFKSAMAHLHRLNEPDSFVISVLDSGDPFQWSNRFARVWKGDFIVPQRLFDGILSIFRSIRVNDCYLKRLNEPDPMTIYIIHVGDLYHWRQND